MIRFITILSIFFQSISFAQQDSIFYSTVDKEAEFPGGMSAMMAWFQRNTIIENKDSFPSKLCFYILINSNGTISAIENVNELKITPEAIQKLISSSPRWIPAQLNGKNMNSKLKIPMFIHLE